MPLLLARTSAPYSKPAIVAAVDPGGHGERESQLDVKIVEAAARLARATDGSVKVVHSVQPAFQLLGMSPRSLQRLRERMRELVARLARGAGLHAGSARVIDGDPAHALLDLVTEDDTDLLVMGTFVRGPLRRALFGSVAERLINVAPCDLLVLKPDGFRSPVPPPRRRRRSS
jgi:universal stress protein E